jgi:hypothetical protein
MSFYTDWFIAGEDEAEKLASSDSPFDEWRSLSLRNIGEVDLMALSAIIHGKEPSQAESVSEGLLYQGSDEGPFVVRVAPAFVDSLANIQDSDWSGLALLWAATEELAGAPPSDLSQTIAQLSAFARQSRLDGKPILGMFVL